MSGGSIVVMMLLLAVGLIALTIWMERRSERSRRRHKADQSAHVMHAIHSTTKGTVTDNVWLVPTDPQQFARATMPNAGEKGQDQ
jgi:predicted lipid-binding transport protein (Tim44 family)